MDAWIGHKCLTKLNRFFFQNMKLAVPQPQKNLGITVLDEPKEREKVRTDVETKSICVIFEMTSLLLFTMRISDDNLLKR